MASLDNLDRNRLLRLYAPRLAQSASLNGPQAPAGTVDDDIETVGGLLNVQVVGDVTDMPAKPDAADADGEEPVETEQTGVMVALYLPPAAAEELALDPGLEDLANIDCEEPEELHLTLAYLGTAGIDLTADRLDDLASAVTGWAATTEPINGVISGIGVFNNEDSVVTYASYDSPALPPARQELVAALGRAGLTVAGDHGFTPHITLAYGDARGIGLPRLPVTFDTVTIAYAGDQMTVPLGGNTHSATPDEAKDEAQKVPLGQDIPPGDDDGDGTDPEGVSDNDSKVTKKVNKDDPPRPQFIASDRTVSLSTAHTTTTDGFASWRPIVTTNGARTVLTGPATVEQAAQWSSAPNSNPHMVWMQGRFVGAERPNRNGAFWSTSDLEFGKPTVANGPLNWLHEERHVIGSIADAKLVRPGTPGPQLLVGDGAPGEQAAETTDPHIVALAGIWSWIYPQEAGVVQMASDAGVLAYSMECIAQAIQCVGDSGCGQTFGYMEVAGAGGGCAHLRQRSSVRRLVNPTFLGGAVIVPPTRPGWADADASVMKEASSLAERAFEQAGRPDIPANTWEQLMAGVVEYTRNAQ